MGYENKNASPKPQRDGNKFVNKTNFKPRDNFFKKDNFKREGANFRDNRNNSYQKREGGGPPKFQGRNNRGGNDSFHKKEGGFQNRNNQGNRPFQKREGGHGHGPPDRKRPFQKREGGNGHQGPPGRQNNFQKRDGGGPNNYQNRDNNRQFQRRDGDNNRQFQKREGGGPQDKFQNRNNNFQKPNGGGRGGPPNKFNKNNNGQGNRQRGENPRNKYKNFTPQNKTMEENEEDAVEIEEKPEKINYCLAPERLEQQKEAFNRFQHEKKDEEIKVFKNEKERKNKLMTKKTKKGQPVMQGRLELLYEKVQRAVAEDGDAKTEG